MKKRVLIFIFAVILIAAAFSIFHNPSKTGQATSNTHTVEITPLSQEEIQKFSQTVLSSEFLGDLPEKYPVAITFFDFETGQRRWRTSFLINKNGFLSEGNPEIYIAINTKYIDELNGNNLCEVLAKANSAGDIALESEGSSASLLIKYRGMLKHRDCFGF